MNSTAVHGFPIRPVLSVRQSCVRYRNANTSFSDKLIDKNYLELRVYINTMYTESSY